MSGGLPTKPKPKSTPTATPTATPTSTPSKPAENGGGGGGATIEQLEADIKVALEKEEYETAASLKKKIAAFKRTSR